MRSLKCRRIQDPDPGAINTSFVECQPWEMRSRRFAQLTCAFGKKICNHRHALALFCFHHSFIRRHQTIGTTPAIRAGMTNHNWTVDELIEFFENDGPLLANVGRMNENSRSLVNHYSITAAIPEN
ncbi:MAG: hypothetical protein MI923_28915 [Phycisphaerales bacterium]|nr:hypothetical protein [Phycisphaerales bacterium]